MMLVATALAYSALISSLNLQGRGDIFPWKDYWPCSLCAILTEIPAALAFWRRGRGPLAVSIAAASSPAIGMAVTSCTNFAARMAHGSALRPTIAGAILHRDA